MRKAIKKFFSENLLLKVISLILALGLWFYIVNELNKGTEQDRRLIKKVLPAENMVAKKLPIRPVFMGSPRRGYEIIKEKVIVIPDFCIVVGTKGLLERVKYVYTVPIDVAGKDKPFNLTIALDPISTGIFMEETVVQVTIPIEKISE